MVFISIFRCPISCAAFQHKRRRVDVVMLTKTDLYVIEMKLNQDAAAAMCQIDLRQYRQRFAIAVKPVTKVGVNFDCMVGNITDWVVE